MTYDGQAEVTAAENTGTVLLSLLICYFLLENAMWKSAEFYVVQFL